MSDLISRQVAITLPVIPKEHREYQTFNLDDAYEQGWNDLQKCIESLPSVQKRGEWIEVDVGDCCYRCSECGFIRDGYLLDISNYCPKCGAKMEKENEII